jgi:hypothetical protein
MANFNYRSQFAYSYAGQKVTLLAKVTIGASGAPTLVSTTGMGISSITRTATGKYAILLTNAFASLLDVNVNFISGTSAPAAPAVNVVTDAVSTASAPTLTIQCRDIAAAAADPANGETMLIAIDLNRSSLPN